ncbi:TetR/AcrR family transcriptional regulator [Nocardia sp. NPDC060220]|uniref:TetR/AcrR family transcriptional regulator n=1 Tax=Nocardia sp. NPDC060220 TaxID=3347076 RepID=UPI0036651DE7
MDPAATAIDGAVPRRLRADAVRNQRLILAAARTLFATRGLGVTLDDVAEHAGVGVGTVYRRFANKQQLIDEVFEQHIEMVVEQAELALTNPDPWDGLVQFFELTCRTVAFDRGLGEVLVGSDAGLARVASVRDRLNPAVVRIIDQARGAGVLRPDVEPNDFFAVIRMVQAIADFSWSVSTEVWRRYFVLVLDGLRGDGPPRAPLPVPPLSDEEIEIARQACASRRRRGAPEFRGAEAVLAPSAETPLRARSGQNRYSST